VTENTRHLCALLLACAIATVGAMMKVCEPMLYGIAGAIITGEYALARSGSARDRRDDNVPKDPR